jgi:hypothetical protein
MFTFWKIAENVFSEEETIHQERDRWGYGKQCTMQKRGE